MTGTIEEMKDALARIREQGPILRYVWMSSQTLELFKDRPLTAKPCTLVPYDGHGFYGVPIRIDETLPDGLVEPEYVTV